MLVLAALLTQVALPDEVKDFVNDFLYSKGRILTFEVTRSVPGATNTQQKKPYELKLMASQGQIREETDSAVAIWDGTRGLRITGSDNPTYWSTDLRPKLFDASMPLGHILLVPGANGSWVMIGNSKGTAYRRTLDRDHILAKVNFSPEGRLQRIVIEPTSDQPEEITYRFKKVENFSPTDSTFSTQPPTGAKPVKAPS